MKSTFLFDVINILIHLALTFHHLLLVLAAYYIPSLFNSTGITNETAVPSVTGQLQFYYFFQTIQRKRCLIIL